MEATKTSMMTYDSEVNFIIDRAEKLAKQFSNIPDGPITRAKLSDGVTPLWYVVDKTTIPANKWAEGLGKYSEQKMASKDLKCVYEAFVDPYTGKPYVGIAPSFIEIDSFTDFEPESTIDMITDGDIDDAKTNTSELKKGLFKFKFLNTLPRIANQGNIYFFLVAHIGEKKDMATGPARYSPPTRKSQYLKAGDVVKGVTDKFFFLTNNAWMLHIASELINKATKGPEYPTLEMVREKELNIVRLTQLRSKTGTSGYTLELLVSQTHGVLPALTEFHYIRMHDRFGFEGTMSNYSLTLFPYVSFGTITRTTIHNMLNENKLLRKAVNFTSELLQLHLFHPHLNTEGLLCSPKELYDDLKDKGYDWNILLQTRGYWTINQYSNPVPFLSTVDLLMMRKDKYFPYWMNEDKSIKKQYIKHFEKHFGETKNGN
jgi:hypothetical protein